MSIGILLIHITYDLKINLLLCTRRIEWQVFSIFLLNPNLLTTYSCRKHFGWIFYLRYLRDTQHFIDKRRVAVWGWSYGGFVASLALASNKNVFQCAIAVSPVTNWKLYDSAYTERFMGLPNVTDNYKGYEEADVSKKALLLKDKMFYIIHGTADDNVHLQQTMALVKALSETGTLFRQQIYPDENHSLGGVKKHLYESMGSFFDDCFRKQVPPEFKAGLRNYLD